MQRIALITIIAGLAAGAALAQNYNGWHDTSNCSIIGGWAVDNNQIDTPINVDIYDGNNYVVTTAANLYRSDLGWIHYYHAFNIATPASLKNNANHTINVKYGGTNLLLPNTGQIINCAPSSTGYQYYYSDTFSSINPAAWYQNGAGLTTNSAGLTSADANGGSLISKAGVPDGTSQYEVKTTLNLTQSGGTYDLYLRASSDALSGPNTASGTYYALEVQNVTFSGGACSATLAFYKRVNGVITLLTSGGMSCHNGMTLRIIYTLNSNIFAYYDNTPLMWISDGAIASGQPGVGVRGAPSTNGIARVDLGPLDRTAPTVMQNPITSSAFGDHIDMKWDGSVDDPNGVGVGFSLLYRTRTDIPNQPQVFVSWMQPGTTAYSDYGVTANQTYSYVVNVYDFHLNSTGFSFPASIPPAGSIDPRQVGVRPLGSYWGGAGEQIDMRSGNLNYTMPLIKALGRGGWGVGINLSYNSQNWRQDPAAVWQLGRDTGYGYGWRLQAGSLTPIYQDYWNIRYWLFIDSTGAEYKLNQWNGSVWSSVEGIYLQFDPNVTGSPGSTHLYFPDGSFWELNALSAGTEQDAGTYYPSLMQDTNGNQILFTYKPGQGVSYPNSSARIATIEDVRGNGTTDYSFTYNTDPIPHLTGITNSIGTPENYTLSYSQAALIQPFASAANNNFGTFKFLQSVEVNGPNLTTSLSYIPTTDPNTNPPTQGYSGELAQMTTPYQGHLRWTYTAYTLSGSRAFREVQYRYLLMCASSMSAYCSANGGTETQHWISRDTNGDLNRTVHSVAELLDMTTNADKYWTFDTASDFSIGLQLHYAERLYPNAFNFNQDFAWSQTPTSLNPYISSTLTTLDSGQSYQAQKKTTQTLDQYGNLTQMQVYDFGNLSTPARYYFNYYLTDSNYISRHITNRLTSSFVVNGGGNCATAPQCTQLVQNSYDVTPYSDIPGVHEHDSNYGTSFTYRGNVTASTTPAATKNVLYDIGGNATRTTVNGVITNITTSSSTNYAAPSQITTNSLSSTANWYPSLYPSSIAGPNSDTASFAFDGNGRPNSTTSPTGANTAYTYFDTASPPYKKATTNTHWVQTYSDGFGHTIETWNNSTSGGGTIVSTFYDPCGCSPLGKVSKISQPYVPNGTVYWTTYTYDASGRTTRVALPDGSHTDYVYQGNTVTVTDPAGKSKTFTMDAFGNLTKVVETDPTLGQVSSNYTYDILNHLTQVSMPRGSNTQTRTFNYIPSGTNSVGAFLLSAINPENGTVNYTYSNGLLVTKTDAKGQVFSYSYDGYNRLTQIILGSTVLRTFIYDSNTLDGSFTSYGAGRLVAVQNAQFTPGSSNPTEFTEMYSYTQAGQPNKKRLQTNLTGLAYPYPVYTANLDTAYTYDTEGKMTSVSYPNAGPTYTYSFDNMSRPTGLTDQNNYAAVSGVQYGGANAPANELSSMGYFGVTETRTYNTLMQMTNVTVGSSFNMTYNYPSGTNNGKISSQSDTISGETVTYAYDSLNRLLSASGSGWSETYGFDGFGSLVSKTPTGGAPQLSIGVNPTNNQVVGHTYDNNGNDSYGSVSYDAENRINFVPGYQYAYDSQNKRIWKGSFSGGNLTAQEVYVFGVDGQKLGTYSLALNGSQITATTTQTAVFFGAKRVAVNGAVFVPDRLGSNTAGKYYPYGEDRGTPIANDQVKFATYTRDSATGMDYADQRYYSNQFARFMTPDSSGVRSVDPGSWNKYAYAGNDPINRLDPSGRDWCTPDDLFCFAPSGASDLGDIIYGLNFDFSGIAAQIAAQVAAALQGVNLDTLASAASAFTDADDARADLGKTNCYKSLGFATAKEAQSWFDNHIHFYDSHDGKLVLRRGVPAGSPTPAPSRTDQAGDIYLNQDYNWGDFSKVTTSAGATYNYLGWFNRTYKSNLNSEQLGTFFIVHELMHNRPSDVAETVKAGQAIINNCLK
jgi:RHS repeat-associated protein